MYMRRMLNSWEQKMLEYALSGDAHIHLHYTIRGLSMDISMQCDGSEAGLAS
jgi:hypothetical protein